MTRPTAMVVRPIPTLVLGAVAGLMVGLTSVGAGSIVVVTLLLMYPRLKASSLVGTDLAQAIPLVAAAAAGHLLFGDFSFSVAASLLIGAIPGAWIGAHISSRAPGGVIRRILAVLLLATGLKLLGVPDMLVIAAAAGAVAFAFVAWGLIRNRVVGPAVRDEAAGVRDRLPALEPAALEPVPVVAGELHPEPEGRGR